MTSMIDVWVVWMSMVSLSFNSIYMVLSSWRLSQAVETSDVVFSSVSHNIDGVVIEISGKKGMAIVWCHIEGDKEMSLSFSKIIPKFGRTIIGGC